MTLAFIINPRKRVDPGFSGHRWPRCLHFTCVRTGLDGPMSGCCCDLDCRPLDPAGSYALVSSTPSQQESACKVPMVASSSAIPSISGSLAIQQTLHSGREGFPSTRWPPQPPDISGVWRTRLTATTLHSCVQADHLWYWLFIPRPATTCKKVKVTKSEGVHCHCQQHPPHDSSPTLVPQSSVQFRRPGFFFLRHWLSVILLSRTVNQEWTATYCFPCANVLDMVQQIPSLLNDHRHGKNVSYIRSNDTAEQSELLKWFQ